MNDWVVNSFNKNEDPVREKKMLQRFLHAWSQMHIAQLQDKQSDKHMSVLY